MFVISQHSKELPLIQQWHYGITLASLFHMLFLVIKIQLKQVRRSTFLSQYKDQGRKKIISYFAEGRSPEPSFPSLHMHVLFAIAFPNTLTSINTMLLKVGKCKFYMICALAFMRFSPPLLKNGKLSATGWLFVALLHIM